MKKTILSLMLVIGLVVSGSLVSAFMGGFGRSEAVETAIENNDFDAWKSAREAEMTEERFAEIVERHAQGESRRALREQRVEAIENNDYEAFLEATNAMRDISEEEFANIVERHNEMIENGFEPGQGMGLGKNQGRNCAGMH